jgi:hypothetical protein
VKQLGLAVLLLALSAPGWGAAHGGSEASAAPAPAPAVVVPQGTQLILETLAELSSRDARTGQQIPLKVVGDVLVDGELVIPGGSQAVGVVVEARDTGGMGVNGRLEIAPLYISIGGETVRLTGGESYSGKTKADAVVGLAITGLVSGRKATIPAGTKLGARVLRDIRLPVAAR